MADWTLGVLEVPGPVFDPDALEAALEEALRKLPPSPEALTALELVKALTGELRETRALVVRVATTIGSIAGLSLGVAGTLAAVCL